MSENASVEYFRFHQRTRWKQENKTQANTQNIRPQDKFIQQCDVCI